MRNAALFAILCFPVITFRIGGGKMYSLAAWFATEGPHAVCDDLALRRRPVPSRPMRQSSVSPGFEILSFFPTGNGGSPSFPSLGGT
jgi:hypothetical protein